MRRSGIAPMHSVQLRWRTIAPYGGRDVVELCHLRAKRAKASGPFSRMFSFTHAVKLSRSRARASQAS
jgi:hypothetical protein